MGAGGDGGWSRDPPHPALAVLPSAPAGGQRREGRAEPPGLRDPPGRAQL